MKKNKCKCGNCNCNCNHTNDIMSKANNVISNQDQPITPYITIRDYYSDPEVYLLGTDDENMVDARRELLCIQFYNEVEYYMMCLINGMINESEVCDDRDKPALFYGIMNTLVNDFNSVFDITEYMGENGIMHPAMSHEYALAIGTTVYNAIAAFGMANGRKHNDNSDSFDFFVTMVTNLILMMYRNINSHFGPAGNVYIED